MIQETFAVGQSVLHSIDPRYRILAAVLFSSVVALSYQPATLLCALGSALLLVILADLDLIQVAKRLSAPLGFLLLLWAVLPVTYDGPVMLRIGPFDIARAGIVLALQISAKSIAILTAFIALIATMTVATLGHTLGRLGVPDKIVYLTLITYRYIFVIEQEYKRLLTAIKIRGFQPGTNLHTYRTYAYLVGMLFVRASTRAHRVNQAMRCRGFQGKFYSFYNHTPSPNNRFFVAALLALLVILFFLEKGNWFT